MKKLFLFFATLCLSVGVMAYDATFLKVGDFAYYGYGTILSIDLNGDGYQSVLFMEDNQWQRSTYLKNDRGTLTAYHTNANVGITELGISPYYDNTGQSHSPSMVAIDVNHDGKQDLVVAPNTWPPVLDVYLSNGINAAMTKANNQTNLIGARDWRYHDCLAAGDYDNDGWEDLFVLGQSSSETKLFIYRNNNGVFEAPNKTLPGYTGGSIAVRDIDKDGNLDIFYTGYEDGEGGGYRAKLYYGDGAGNWTEDANNTGFHRPILGDVAIIDFDNDGYPDLLEQGRDYYATNIWKNNQDKTFTKYDATATGLPNANDLYIDYGDFNLDGYMDIIAVAESLGSTGSVTAVFLNNGNFTFTRQDLDNKAYWGGVFAWDYDKDGKSDYIAWGHLSSGSDWACPIVHNTTIPAIALSENVDNSAILAKWNGQTANVTLTRNMVADGSFHTLCLPFSLNASQIEAAFGASYELKELNEASMEGETLNLAFADASSIEAGKPYLFKPAATINAPIAINGVTINTTLAPQTKADLVTFTGILNPTTLTAENRNTLFLGDENTLYWPSETANMPGMRAYFAIHSVAVNVAAARVFLGGKILTGTESIMPSVANIQKVLDKGQVVIIFKGIRYNVMGQKIK